MKRILSLLIVVAIFMSAMAFSAYGAEQTATLPAPEVIEGIPAESENFHIYLCIGQSNMVGADKVRDEDIVKVDRVYLYNLESKWEVAQPYPVTTSEYMGYNRYSTAKPGSGRMGPTVGFARGMALKAPDEVKIGIISNAIGGTTVQEWSKGYGQAADLPLMEDRPDRDLFEKAVERTKEALAKGGVLKGIFYLQGESCASKAGYMDRLSEIAKELRADIGVKAEDVPFFVSEIPYVRANGVEVIKTAPEHIENCYVISAQGLLIFDSIHFDAVSQRRLGLRFAETALSKVYGITASADDMYMEIYGTDFPRIEDLPQTVIVNGKTMEFDVPAKVAGDRLFVPVRAILEEAGWEIFWDEASETVSGKRNDRTFAMQIGDEHLEVNGKKTAMGLAPMLKDLRTLAPLEFVEKILNATARWIETTQVATINFTEDEVIKEFKPMYPDIPDALTVYGVKQTGDDGTNSIVNILDGDSDTMWAVTVDKDGNDGYGIIDLGSVKTIDKLYIAFQAHATRIYTYSIMVSENGEDYVTVLDKKSTNNKEGKLEAYDLGGIKARYVKYIGHGNNQNAWNRLGEIVITGK